MANTLALIAYHQGKAGNEFDIIGYESCLVDTNANNVIEHARKMNADWLFFFDYDVEYLLSGDVLDYMVSQNKDVLCGVYYQGLFPFRPVLYNFTNDGLLENYVTIPDGLFKIDSAGAGFCLISKKVLDLLTEEENEKSGKPFDPIMRGTQVHLRADAAFFWRLKKLGVEVWACPDIPLAHIKKNKVVRSFFEKSKEMIVNAQSAPDNG